VAHAKKAHPDVSAADFKKALEQKLSSDPSTVDLRRVTRSVNMVSATERVRDVRDQLRHIRSLAGNRQLKLDPKAAHFLALTLLGMID